MSFTEHLHHLDKGIFFTTKQALVRPVKAALDYIAGKRKSYYNVFFVDIDNYWNNLVFQAFL